MMEAKELSYEDLKGMHKMQQELYECAKDDVNRGKASVILRMLDDELKERGFDPSELFDGYRHPSEREFEPKKTLTARYVKCEAKTGLKFKDYSEFTDSTMIHSSDPVLDDIYPIIKLPGEVGELCEKVGKVMRDQGGEYMPEDIRLIKKELGDILWYVDKVAKIFGSDLEEVAQMNIDKIKKRFETGTERGSGDERETLNVYTKDEGDGAD